MSLQPNTTYYYRVKAINSEQESDYSDVMSVTTLPDQAFLGTVLPPSTPTIIKSNVYSNSIELVLETPPKQEYIQEYKLTVSTNADYSAPILSNLTYNLKNNLSSAYINQVNYLVLTIPNLVENTTYYIRLKASNSVSLSGNRDLSLVTTDSLNAPTAYGVTDLTAITARANWSKVTGADTYILDVSTNDIFTSLVVDNLDVGDVDFKDIPVLLETTNYYFRVKAVSGTIESPYSNVISFTTLDDIATNPNLSYNLNTPTIFGASNVYTDRLDVIWFSVDKATEYLVDVSTSIGFSTFVLQDVSVSETRLSIDSLSAGTIYYIRVKAKNGNIESVYTTPLAISTLTVNVNLATPQLLPVNQVFSNAAVITWVKRTYALRYFIQVSTVSNFSTLLSEIFVNDIDSFILEKLTPNTVYYVRIYALNNTNTSNASSSVTFTTAAILPTINLTSITELTSSTARLSWSLQTAYTNYSITIYKKLDYLTILQGGTNYLGDGFFNDFNVGNVSNYLIDLFLEASTTYNYLIKGYTANGDYKTSALGEFTTKSSAPIIQISNDGTLLEWSGNLNRLEVSTDKYFKTLVQGWHPRTITATNSFNISNLTKSDISYYIRGYNQIDSIKGEYSNIVSTSNNLPTFLPITVTDTTAYIKWKKNNYTLFSIQVFVDNIGEYIPVTGFTLPKTIGDVDFYFLNNLTPDTNYYCLLNYFDSVRNRFDSLSLPLYFKTNEFNNIEDTTESGTAIVATASNISFDRCIINLPDTSKYQITVSKRSDFLTIEKYIEIESITEYTLLLSNNSPYYINVYKVTGTNRTEPCLITLNTLAIDDFPASTTSASTVAAPVVLNDVEVILTWTVVLNASGYVLEIAESNTFNLLATSVNIKMLDINKALVTGLVKTKTYYARVYGYNANSIGQYSNTVTISTNI